MTSADMFERYKDVCVELQAERQKRELLEEQNFQLREKLGEALRSLDAFTYREKLEESASVGGA